MSCLVGVEIGIGNADQMAVSNVNYYYYLSATYLRVLLLARLSRLLVVTRREVSISKRQ